MKVGNQLQVKLSSTNQLSGGCRIPFSLILILATAFVVRLFLAFTAHWPAFSDSRDYHVLARNLLDGAGYLQKYHGENPVHEGFTFYAYRMPGYPIFLALIYGLFGFAARNAYLAQAILETCGLYLFWMLTQRYLSTRAALIAVFFLSSNIFWTGLLTTEVLFNSLVLVLITWLSYRDRDNSLYEVLLVGVLLAITILVRPVALLLIPIFLWRLRGARKVLLIVPLTVFLVAWGIRNERVLGTPVLLSTNSGWHNAPRFGVDRAEIFTRMRNDWRNEAEINAELTRRIVQRVEEDPKAAAEILLERFSQMFTLSPPHEIGQFIFKRTYSSDMSSVLQVFWYQFWLTYPLAALGVIYYWRDSRMRALFLISVATIALHGLMSDGSFRFFAPWYFVLCLFAGAATDLMIQKCLPTSKSF